MNTVLIGFKSAGKTSVGQYLATQTQQLFVDTDRLLEQRYQHLTQQVRSVREIYQQHGAAYFRAMEKNILADLNVDNHVIATGGGCITEPANKDRLRKLGRVIYLHAAFETLLQRFNNQPLPAFLSHLEYEENLYTLYQQRQPLYQAAANHTIAVDAKSIPTIATEISAFMRETVYGQ